MHTTDRFWLPGCDLMKRASSHWNIYDFKDSVYGLCEEREFNSHLRPSYVNGSLGPSSYSYCWLRSAYADYSGAVAYLVAAVSTATAWTTYYGLSPACTIG